MIRIGLTGGIGSGKSAVAGCFSSMQVPVIDTDIIARELVDHSPEILKQIASTFGNGVIQPDGTLNRAMLADMVFTDDSGMKKLESILHPQIRRLVSERTAQLEALGTPYVVIVVPLLLETDFYKLVDRILVVSAPESVRLERVQKRDNRSYDEVSAIMSRQLDEHSRRARADDIIDNDAGMDHIEAQVASLHHKYLSQSTLR